MGGNKNWRRSMGAMFGSSSTKSDVSGPSEPKVVAPYTHVPVHAYASHVSTTGGKAHGRQSPLPPPELRETPLNTSYREQRSMTDRSSRRFQIMWASM
ncbi:hypothetical protein MMC25_000390 [Agyrium rufum]|nr:hypothetical protein [Agyrium rufum]